MLGIGGLFDVVILEGIFKYDEDFGQIFGCWGVSEGVYVFILILGLCIVCDMVGVVVDLWVDFLNQVDDVVVCNSLWVLCVVNIWVNFLLVDKVIEEVVLDKYFYICDVYLQNCCNLVYDGNLLVCLIDE